MYAPWWCTTCGQKNTGWANACGRCLSSKPDPREMALLPCPCCRAPAALVVEDERDVSYTAVRCSECRLSTPREPWLGDGAIDAAARVVSIWNRRP